MKFSNAQRAKLKQSNMQAMADWADASTGCKEIFRNKYFPFDYLVGNGFVLFIKQLKLTDFMISANVLHTGINHFRLHIGRIDKG